MFWNIIINSWEVCAFINHSVKTEKCFEMCWSL